ncbi:hypothetical protein BMS3Bbin16_00727 [archaeon BMS3Bbin16]|nr:hypothetical protein BMS3Bbin16_00727 [archaeon BMS3Bbin16]
MRNIRYDISLHLVNILKRGQVLLSALELAILLFNRLLQRLNISSLHPFYNVKLSDKPRDLTFTIHNYKPADIILLHHPRNLIDRGANPNRLHRTAHNPLNKSPLHVHTLMKQSGNITLSYNPDRPTLIFNNYAANRVLSHL